MYAGTPKHPIFSGGTFGLMSGDKPLFNPQVHGGHEQLVHTLKAMGLPFEETQGKYKEPERSVIIHNATPQQMTKLGKLFGQESIIHSQGGQHKLIYTNGANEGKYHTAHMQTPMEHFDLPPQDMYTMIPGHGYMRMNFDFNQLQDMEPVKQVEAPAPPPAQPAAKKEREFTPDQAAFLAKNAVASLLQAQVSRPHPHFYEWHDGHTDHHREDLGQPQLPGLRKDLQSIQAHPHMDAPPAPGEQHLPATSEKPWGSDQNAPVGVSSYHKYALPYGQVMPGQKTDLLHYKYQGKLPAIEKLVKDHGYQVYYGGGKYGKPDLANKNYNTGHLMVYDPTPGQGGDFGHEEYTRGWRQIHELSHALTYPELNKIYGEGRRMGKLGTHRTLNEAMRVVHWEWLAAHKQRELSEKVGVHVSDQDFNRELNTVMHDAVHRAVTGKFTEPSGEGYTPHSHKIPLSTALQMVRDAGHQMGLQGLHDVLQRKMEKALPPPGGLTAPPAAVKPAAPQLHNTVEGFMGGLKALPKGDPSRGKFITSHMNHPPFLAALQAHPQGKQVHAMLTQHMNSVANAGFKPGAAKVVAKSEQETILSARGDTSVAEEKLYTPEEAREILLKATKEKVATFEKEIAALRDRELKKALIVNHKHNTGVSAGAGVEDVPAAQMKAESLSKPPVSQAQRAAMGAAASGHSTLGIPKKVGKEFIDADKGGKLPVHKNTMQGYPGGPGPVAGPQTGGGPMAMAELCKTCGLNKKMCKCMGKTELVDAKGQHKETGVVGKRPDDKKPAHVNKPGASAKTAGSGGIVLPGKKPRAAGPVTKQAVNDKHNDQGKKSDLVAGDAKKLPQDPSQPKLVEGGLGKLKTAPAKLVAEKGEKFKKDEGMGGNHESLPPGATSEVKKNQPCPKCGHVGHQDPAGNPVDHATAVLHEPMPTKSVMPKGPYNGPASKRVRKALTSAATPMAMAEPPMAKPPSGKNMGTGVPTSAPKPPAMMKGVRSPGEEALIAKAGLPATPKAQAQQHGLMAGSKAAAAAPAAGVSPVHPGAPMPSPAQHAQRAAGHQAALAGEFQPKGPVSSGLELARPPKVAAPAGLKAPPAAARPGASAAPAVRPGIFGRMGKSAPAPAPVKKIYDTGM